MKKLLLLLTVVTIGFGSTATVFAFSEANNDEREERRATVESVLEAANIDLTIFKEFRTKINELRTSENFDRDVMHALRDEYKEANQEYFDTIHETLDIAGIERGPRVGRGERQGQGRGMKNRQ